jgi:hypothetical protein
MAQTQDGRSKSGMAAGFGAAAIRGWRMKESRSGGCQSRLETQLIRLSKFPRPALKPVAKPIANVAFKPEVEATSHQSRIGAQTKRPSRKFGGNSVKCRFSLVGRATDL